jgi:hypothetical protein
LKVQKKFNKIIWASSARNGSFGVFFEKKGVKLAPLSWRPTCWRPEHVGARHVRARYIGTLLEWAS